MNKRTQLGVWLCCLLLSLGAWAATAAGQPDEAERLVPPPPVTRSYVVASPRAALITPQPIANVLVPYRIGAAENFPRHYGTLKVRPGTRVLFRLSPEIEGVWYERAYGVLGTSLELQWCRRCKITCDCPDRVADLPEVAAKDDSSLRPVEPTVGWVTIGKDGARALRHGPSIGTADVKVPVRFWSPGIYWLRAIVTTYAEPRYPDPTTLPKPLPALLGDRDRDIVYIRVHVVDWPDVIADPDPELPLDPDAAHAEDMPRDPNAGPEIVDAELDTNVLTVSTH